MNQVEVCNLALGRIGTGASRPIQALDEGSEAANACLRVFQPSLDAMLREYAWPFSIRSALLAETAETVDGYAHAYAYPDNCAYLRAIGPSGLDPRRFPGSRARVDFILVASTDGESLLVATDLDAPRGWYTVNITNPNVGDALFQDALAWRLAGELALGMKADPKMAQNAGQQYTLALSKALAAVGNEVNTGQEEWNAEAVSLQRGFGADFLDQLTWPR